MFFNLWCVLSYRLFMSADDMSNISVMTVNETVAPSAGDISRISAISVPQ